MGTRTGRISKPDDRGQFARQLGWKINASGKRVQHKFRLGTDRTTAELREALLRRIWNVIEKASDTGQQLWDETTLVIAVQVAGGADRVRLPVVDQNEAAVEYRYRLQQIQNRFPFLRFEPEDIQRFKQGLTDDEISCDGIVLDDLALRVMQRRRQYEASESLNHPIVPPIDVDVLLTDTRPLSSPTQATRDDGKTLHEAFDAYENWIEKEYYRPELKGVSEYGHTKLGQIKTLKERHDDVPLKNVDFDHIEVMYRYWRQRPASRAKATAGKPMSTDSVRHYLGELERFFKWLHRSSEFLWRKPEGFEDLEKRVDVSTSEIKASIRQVPLFQLEELRILNRHATPMDRLYLMLALNCGFGTKEISTLTIGECYLNQGLPPDEQELFQFPTTTEHSFVSLVRNKTTIVGKYLLFKQTADMLRWAMVRRLNQPNPALDQPLILNGNGKPLDNRSKAGNPSRQIPNSFKRLQERAAFNGERVSALPFKCLRKTAGDLIRRASDGEVSGVFLLHGSPVAKDKLSDVYTNRPFGKVYRAIQQVEDYLQSVFAEAPNPTEEQLQAYTPRNVIDVIAEMHQAGSSVREIEAKVPLSRSTIHRHISRLAGGEHS